MGKKKISIFLAVIISFSIFVGASADELSDAEKLKKSISDNTQKLKEVNGKKLELDGEVQKLDSQINDISKKMASLNTQIASLDKEISAAEKNIKEYEEKLQVENELLRKRLRALYTTGGTGYMEILFDSKSFSDFFRKVDSIKRIVDYDKELEESIINSKKIIESNKSEAEKKKSKIVVLKNQAEAQRKDIEKNSNEKKKLMASLEKDKVAYEKMIAKEESEAKRLQDIIQKKLEEGNKKGTTGSGGGTVVNRNDLHCVTGRGYTITSPYGWRVHPVLGYRRFHAGLDIGVPYGTPLYSLKDGVVIYSGVMDGYGNVVMINHGDITSLYAHNSTLLVSEGQSVKGGQMITYSGNSGLSSGPHLHFEIRTSSGTVNPEPYYIR